MDDLTAGLIIGGSTVAFNAAISITDGLVKRHFAKTAKHQNNTCEIREHGQSLQASAEVSNTNDQKESA